ncbi:MAG: CBS domain-containing protein [Candidatus Hydrothermarchaeales archaeon]
MVKMYTLPTPEEIKKYRRKVGLTQTKVARRAGVSQSLIARIEAGDVDPRISTLKRIIDVLKEEEEVGTLTAETLMRDPVLSVRSIDTIGKASKIMEEADVSQLPVIDRGLQVGSISETRIIKELTSGRDITKLSAMKVVEIMNGGFPTVYPHADVKTLTNIVELNPAVLVVDKGKIKGIITKTDVVRLIKK